MQFVKNDPTEAERFFRNKLQFTTGPVELEHELASGAVCVIDVRAADDYNKAHIPGSVNLPKDRWDTLEGLSRDKLNVLVCYSQVCHLAAVAALTFAHHGFSVMEMEGGFKSWQEHKLPVEKQGQPSPSQQEVGRA